MSLCLGFVRLGRLTLSEIAVNTIEAVVWKLETFVVYYKCFFSYASNARIPYTAVNGEVY